MIPRRRAAAAAGAGRRCGTPRSVVQSATTNPAAGSTAVRVAGVVPTRARPARRPDGGFDDHAFPARPPCGHPRAGGRCAAVRVRRRRLPEPRRARHDVLRREQGPGRRRAGGPEEVEEPVDDRVHVHARRGPGRVREHLQAVHDAPFQVPRQEGRLLPGAEQRGRDRGDALGPAARRRLLHRPDGVRGEPRGRDPVRGQGHREGLPGLQPDRHRQGELAVPEALGPEGQEGRAHVAVVELRPPGAARAVPGRGPRA